MAKRTDGKTTSGKEITDELVEKLAGEAEAGYDVVDGMSVMSVRCADMTGWDESRPPTSPPRRTTAFAKEVHSWHIVRRALVERSERDSETHAVADLREHGVTRMRTPAVNPRL